MTDPTNYRARRIERLFTELQYEITRGMMEGEIDEQSVFSFVVPISRTFPKHGVVQCRFESRPVESIAFLGGPLEPRLKLVKS